MINLVQRINRYEDSNLNSELDNMCNAINKLTTFKSVSSSYSVVNSDENILVDSSSGVVTVTLPTALGFGGKRFTIKDWKGSSATHNITLATSNSQTIDGASTKTLSTNYQSIEVISDDSNWSVIS